MKNHQQRPGDFTEKFMGDVVGKIMMEILALETVLPGGAETWRFFCGLFRLVKYVEFSQVDYHKATPLLSLWIRKMMINQDTLPSIVLFPDNFRMFQWGKVIINLEIFVAAISLDFNGKNMNLRFLGPISRISPIWTFPFLQMGTSYSFWDSLYMWVSIKERGTRATPKWRFIRENHDQP